MTTHPLSDSPVAYYPKNRYKWDYRTGTVRLDHLDDLIAQHTNPNNSIRPDLAQIIATWEHPMERGYYLLPMQQILPLATTSPLRLRALIALCSIWQAREGHRTMRAGKRYKGKQIYATTANNKTNLTAIRYMPRLTPHQLACLCYPADKWHNLTREHRYKAKASLRKLEAAGHIAIITANSKHWQIAKPYTPPWC